MSKYYHRSQIYGRTTTINFVYIQAKGVKHKQLGNTRLFCNRANNLHNSGRQIQQKQSKNTRAAWCAKEFGTPTLIFPTYALSSRHNCFASMALRKSTKNSLFVLYWYKCTEKSNWCFQYQGKDGWMPRNYYGLCEKILGKSQTVVCVCCRTMELLSLHALQYICCLLIWCLTK